MRLIRYRPEFQEAVLALHRSIVADLSEGISQQKEDTDQKTVEQIYLSMGISQQEEESDLRDIEQIYIKDGGEFLVGLLDGAVIAMGGFQRLSDTSAELRRMRIRKDLQGQGYGSRLLLELEQKASQSGIRTLSFETARARPLTLEFYRKHGYQETGYGFYGEVETVHFSKTLNPDRH